MGKKTDSSKSLENFLSTNNLFDFLRLIKNIPTATMERNYELAELIRQGDKNAREQMILENLRLVIGESLKDTDGLSNYEKLDLLNEGIIGLIHAVDLYDSDEGIAFSSYAIPAIKRQIKQSTLNYAMAIRRPVYFDKVKSDYNRLRNDYQNRGIPLPSDKELCHLLEITPDTLRLLERDKNLNPDSLDRFIEGEEGKKVSDTVADHADNYAGIINKMANDTMLACLKTHLSAVEYFILYHRFLKTTPDTLEVIGDKLFMSRERVRQIQNRTLKKIRPLFDELDFIGYLPTETRKLVDAGRYKLEPLSPKMITRFLFARDFLTPSEREILRIATFDNKKYTIKEMAELMNMDVPIVRSIQTSLNEKLEYYLKRYADYYVTFSNNIVRHYHSNLFRIDLETDVSEFMKINCDMAYNIWKDKTYDEFERVYVEKYGPLTDDLKTSLKEFFGIIESDYVTQSRLEKKINCLVFGFYDKSDIPKPELYRTLEKNLDKFTPNQIVELNFLLGKITFEELKRQIPDYLYHGSESQSSYEKLVAIHFGVRSYKLYQFDLARYTNIRDKCIGKISDESIRIMDLYLGYECPAHSLEEMSTILGLATVKETENKISTARTQVINVYLGISQYLDLDKTIYANYLRNHKLDFNERDAEILQLFFLEKKTYEEISAKTGLSIKRISVSITQSILRIDFARFGIVNEITYDKKDLFATLTTASFENRTKDIIRDYIDTEDLEAVSQKYDVSKTKVIAYLSKLKSLVLKDKTTDYPLTIEMIEREVNAPEYENVIPKDGRLLLSLYCGFQNRYNIDGKKHSILEIAKLLQISTSTANLNKARYLTSIRAKKLGLLKAPFDIIDILDLKRLFKDPHVPISKKERENLALLYGLEGNEPLTIKELAFRNGEHENSTRLRIRRAIVNLRRYDMGEIEGKVSYSKDVVPYLKYFTKEDRRILKELYDDELTFDQIASTRGWKQNEVLKHINMLRYFLKDFQEGYKTALDFDYFWSTVQNEDVPFYGNKELAIHLFDLFYEHDLPVSQIKSTYYPNMTPDTIRRNISALIIAVCKRRIGIEKTKDYTYEQVRDYYLAHKHEMTADSLVQYAKYFRRFQRVDIPGSRNTPLAIAGDLLKNEANYIKLENASREEIMDIIKKYREHFSHRELNTLYHLFDIHPRTFMKGHDKRRVLEVLTRVTPSLDKRLKLDSKPQ